MQILNLDTHVLIFALRNEINPAEQRLLADNEWSVSPIVFWELAKLVQLDRIDIDLSDREVLRVLKSLRVWPLDFVVARVSTRLDFSSDPADEIIAATSIVYDVPLITRDKTMRNSKIVPLAL